MKEIPQVVATSYYPQLRYKVVHLILGLHSSFPLHSQTFRVFLWHAGSDFCFFSFSNFFSQWI